MTYFNITPKKLTLFDIHAIILSVISAKGAAQ